MKPGVPQWPREPLLTRLHRCRTMLDIHGLLTYEDDFRIRRRLAKFEPPSTNAVDPSAQLPGTPTPRDPDSSASDVGGLAPEDVCR